jgi:hypothetical protein
MAEFMSQFVQAFHRQGVASLTRIVYRIVQLVTQTLQLLRIYSYFS